MKLELVDTNLQTINTKILQNYQIVIKDNIVQSTENCFDSDARKIFNILTDNADHIGQIEAETGRKITFGEMKDRSVSLAIWLIKQGVNSGDVVAICSSDHLSIYNVILATLFIEAIYSPWDMAMNLELARHYINSTQPKVIFTSNKKTEMLKEAAKLENHQVQIITLDCADGFLDINEILSLQTVDEINNFEVTDNPNPERIASIFFTSGTTGLSKGVALSNKAYFKRIFCFGTSDEMQNCNRVSFTHLSPSWDIHTHTFLYGIVTKATQVFHPNFSLIETPRIIKDYKVQNLYTRYYSMVLLADACIESNYILESVVKVVAFGSKINQRVIDKIQSCMPNAFLFKSMGVTECGQIANNRNMCKNPSSTGTVSPGVQLKVLDLNTGKQLGPNEIGELYAKTPGMMTEYLKDPESTALSFDGTGFYRTGDEAYYDENGELVMVGRLKEMIRYRHHNIQPGSIEQVLKNHPSIIDVAIVGIPHDVDVQRGVAFVESVSGTKVEEEELLKMISHLELEDFLKGCVRFIEKLPRNTNGKVDKRALQKLAVQLTNTLEE